MRAAGKALDLHVEAVATALIFFHRFFMRHSFLKHERMFIGSACLFVASKVEENPKRVEVVMGKCYTVWHGREPPAEHEKAFKRLREKILIAERCVLHTLGFQLTVRHPYLAVMELLKRLFAQGRGADGGNGVNKALNRQLNQVTTSFVNDSMLTTVCLQYDPTEIAAAVVYLSYLYMELPRVETTLLDTSDAMIADICCVILSLYDERGPGHLADDDDLPDKLGQQMMAEASATAAASTPATASVSPATPPTPSHKPTMETGAASPPTSDSNAGGSSEGVKLDRRRSSGSSSGAFARLASRSADEETRYRDPRSSSSARSAKRQKL
ncbi:unnamed protein product [Ascophyllum nodosum]